MTKFLINHTSSHVLLNIVKESQLFMKCTWTWAKRAFILCIDLSVCRSCFRWSVYEKNGNCHLMFKMCPACVCSEIYVRDAIDHWDRISFPRQRIVRTSDLIYCHSPYCRITADYVLFSYCFLRLSSKNWSAVIAINLSNSIMIGIIDLAKMKKNATVDRDGHKTRRQTGTRWILWMMKS